MDRFEPLVEAFKRRLRSKLMRRLQDHPERGAIHLRRSLRQALSTGGELVQLHHVRRKRRLPQVAVDARDALEDDCRQWPRARQHAPVQLRLREIQYRLCALQRLKQL